MDYLDKVLQIVETYRHLGERTLYDGTRLVGHVPHVAPQAWLHSIYAPLSGRAVAALEARLECTIPTVFGDFLQRCNGLHLFSAQLHIGGSQDAVTRIGDEGLWKPFDLGIPNLYERPTGAKPTFFFIGGYQQDGSHLYIDAADRRVHRCKMRTAKSLNCWSDFGTVLEQETQRLAQIFDRHGRQTSQRTTP
jgi:hypothetical protein